MAINHFKHRGLKRFFLRGDSQQVPPSFADRIEKRLNALNRAASPQDMNVPGYRLHELTGNRKGEWSVQVSGNWRIVFRFVDGHAVDVDLVDYH